MNAWLQVLTIIAFSLYFAAWWLVVDSTTRLRDQPGWYFVAIAFLTMGIPMMTADQTYRMPTLSAWLIGGWYVLPFVLVTVLTASGRCAVLNKLFQRRDNAAK